MDLQEDIPSICAQKLKFNQVDLALVPVALLAELPQYIINTSYCIGANGAVESVKLYSQVPLDQIESVTLDYQSKSSITLTKVLFKFFWKQTPKYLEARPGFENEIDGRNAAVVIGDRTFALNGTFAYEFDLALEWKKMTGLPFVFAAWVSTVELDAQFISDFNAVLENGVQHIVDAVEEDYKPGLLSKEKTLDYLQNKIDYRLDADKIQALNLFLDFIGQL
jgi:chorismate dehydratase